MHLIRTILEIRIRRIQAVAVAPDRAFCSSLSDPRKNGRHGLAENMAIKAMLIEAAEKKAKTFNRNLN